jgi:hypothetical protein
MDTLTKKLCPEVLYLIFGFLSFVDLISASKAFEVRLFNQSSKGTQSNSWYDLLRNANLKLNAFFLMGHVEGFGLNIQE